MFGLVTFYQKKAKLLIEEALSMSRSSIDNNHLIKIEKEINKAATIIEGRRELRFMDCSVSLSMALCLMMQRRYKEFEIYLKRGIVG